MKNLKRTLGLLLAMIMALSLPLTAHAAVLSNTASNWNGTYYCVSCGRRLSLDFDEQTDWGHQRGWVCTNSSCDYYINGSGSVTQNQRLQYTINGAHKFGSDGECTICGYYDSSQASCSHDRTTYEYEYDTATYHYCIEYCRDCGEELDSYRERHSLEEDCTYYNSSYHTYESYCPDCDTVIDSQREAHNWSYDYTPYSSTQHRVDMTCYDCGYDTSDYESHNWGTATYTPSGSSQHLVSKTCRDCGEVSTSYAAHTDSNGDGRCDSCGYSMSVTVTWNASANGGTVNGQSSVTTSVTSGSVASAPSYTPTKTGHTFKGWYTVASGGSLYSSVSVTSARTFYAQFTPAVYTITWNLGDGKTTTTSQTYGAALTLPSTPTRAGYTFVGWYTASTGGSQVTASTTYTTVGSTTYYARWTSNAYTITWNLGDGRTETSSQTYGAKLVLPEDPSRSGYTFAGWYTSSTSGTQVTSSTTYTTAGATTYYARWTGNAYTITWDMGDGKTETTSQIYGTNLILPTAPTKVGHTFMGWYTAKTGGTQVTGNTIYQTQGPSTYYARWEARSYAITWDLGGGKTETTQQTYGEPLTLPSDPVKDEYTFDGWYTAETGGTEVTEDTVYTADGPSTYYARWAKVQAFSVTVPAVLSLAMGEDGRVHTSEASIINHSTGAVRVSSITAATKNGWKLVSWDTDMAREKVDTRLIGFTLNGVETKGGAGSESLPLTGDWTIPQDGSLPLRYDAVISALSQPVTDQAVLSVVFVLEWA